MKSPRWIAFSFVLLVGQVAIAGPETLVLNSLPPKSPITCFATLLNFSCYQTCVEQDGLSKSIS
jgi:hypothetical protein